MGANIDHVPANLYEHLTGLAALAKEVEAVPEIAKWNKEHEKNIPPKEWATPIPTAAEKRALPWLKSTLFAIHEYTDEHFSDSVQFKRYCNDTLFS